MKKSISIVLTVAIFWMGGISANAAGLEDFFNAKYYADKYTDLYEAFGNSAKALLNHFETYGLKEKRNMSPVLDVVVYRGTYADLEEAFGDDWDAYVDHYFTYGIKEGRYNGTGFDPQYYLNSYADLKAAFGDDLVAATKHYIEYGYNEGRTEIKTPAPVVSKTPSTTTFVEDGVTYVRDANGNITKAIFPDGSYIDFKYDSSGNMTRVEASDGYWIEYEYDANGNRIRETDSDGYWTEYEYDANGNKIKETDSDGMVKEYDANGNETKRSWSDGTWEAYEYDANGEKIKTTFPEGTWETYEYDANGYVNKIYCYNSSGKIERVEEHQRDANGVWLGQTQTNYYDYEANQVSRIIKWDNTGSVTSDIEYNEDGTVKNVNE